MTDEQMRQAFRILLDLWEEAKEREDNREREENYEQTNKERQQ